MSSKGDDACKVYVGNLPQHIKTRDLDDVFYKYGKIVDVDLKNTRGGDAIPFAFVEFEDPRDAEDAVRERDGYTFDGCKLRVEYPRSSARGRGGRGRDGYGGFRGGRGGGFGGGGRKPRGYQLLVSGLPETGSWQDMKDHFREAGDVIFAESYKDGTGTVEFSRYEHMKRALRDLDGSKFRSHEVGYQLSALRVVLYVTSFPLRMRLVTSTWKTLQQQDPVQDHVQDHVHVVTALLAVAATATAIAGPDPVLVERKDLRKLFDWLSGRFRYALLYIATTHAHTAHCKYARVFSSLQINLHIRRKCVCYVEVYNVHFSFPCAQPHQTPQSHGIH
jgi:arginine/serine-rich splicing factor 1/9